MRLVCVADSHLFHADLTVPDGDVLVHAGDLLREGTLEELREAVEHLATLPHRHKVLVAGNHDGCFEQSPALARAALPPDVTYLQDSGQDVLGIRFWGSPWQPAYNDWAFNLPRGAPLAKKWAIIPTGTQVLVTHSPPFGFGDGHRVGRPHGCDALLQRVAEVRPALHLFGHIHQDGGLWKDGGTTYVNCTTWECQRPPTVLDVETVDGRLVVTPVVVPPRS